MNGYSEHDFSQLKRIKNALICDSLMNIDYTQNDWKYTWANDYIKILKFQIAVCNSW